PDLLRPEALSSPDAWVVVAATLEQAKAGNHAPVAALSRWLKPEFSPLLIRACCDLIGDAGTSQALQKLAQVRLEAIDYLRVEACRGAAFAGQLWLVPFMLESLQQLERYAYRGEIVHKISLILDREGDNRFGEVGPSLKRYVRRVQSRVDRLAEKYGSD